MAEMTKEKLRERLIKTLHRRGYGTVWEAYKSLDKGTPLSRLNGVGPRLEPVMQEMVDELKRAQSQDPPIGG